VRSLVLTHTSVVSSKLAGRPKRFGSGVILVIQIKTFSDLYTEESCSNPIVFVIYQAQLRRADYRCLFIRLRSITNSFSHVFQTHLVQTAFVILNLYNWDLIQIV